jgi:hypothetical protein
VRSVRCEMWRVQLCVSRGALMGAESSTFRQSGGTCSGVRGAAALPPYPPSFSGPDLTKRASEAAAAVTQELAPPHSLTHSLTHSGRVR